MLALVPNALLLNGLFVATVKKGQGRNTTDVKKVI